MLQPYIESATALSDKFIARNDDFWRALEIYFHYETKARKVMVDLKFDALQGCPQSALAWRSAALLITKKI